PKCNARSPQPARRGRTPGSWRTHHKPFPGRRGVTLSGLEIQPSRAGFMSTSSRTRAWRCATLLSAGLVLANFHGLAANDKMPAPLFEGIGNLHHPITTKSELAQQYFNQGLTIVFGFNHTESMRSFQAAAQADPDCAMAY